MKRLIEKGIGVMLWCLQMVMLVGAIILILCGLVTIIYHMIIEDTCSWDTPLLSVLIMLLGTALWVFCFAVLPCFGLIASVPCMLLRDIFQKRKKTNFYYDYKKVGEIDGVIHEVYRYSVGQSAADHIIVDTAYQHKMSLKSTTIFLSPMENFLRNAGAAILLSRHSKEDIERNRKEANANMAFYLANKDKVVRRFEEQRDQREGRNQQAETCEKMMIDYVKSFLRVPVIHCDSVWSDLKSWGKRVGIIILYATFSLAMYKWMSAGDDNVFNVGTFGLFIMADLFAAGVFISVFFVIRDALGIAKFARTVPDEYEESGESLNYKESAFAFVDFLTAQSYYSDGQMLMAKYHILDIFQAFLDLHKDGWRMKIFPFSRERIHEEKRLAHERGEEIVIFPDVDEIDARLAEEERREQMIASIGDA